MLHCLPQVPDSNAYSQVQGDVSGDGEPQVKAIAIGSQLSIDIQNVRTTDLQPVQNPEFTPCHRSWQPFAEHCFMPALCWACGPYRHAYFGHHHGPLQRFGCPHFMARHAEDQTDGVSPKVPMGEWLPEPECEPRTVWLQNSICKASKCEFQFLFSWEDSDFYFQLYLEKKVLFLRKWNSGTSKQLEVRVKRTFTLTLKLQNVESQTHAMPKLALWPHL